MLRRLHADGRKIVVITNESTDRFKKSEAIEKAILKKTGRLMGFAKAHDRLHALCSALRALCRTLCTCPARALHASLRALHPFLHPTPGSGRADACAVRHGQGQLPQAGHRRVGLPGGGGQRRCTATAERELLCEYSAPAVASAPSAPCLCTHCSPLQPLRALQSLHSLPSAPSYPRPRAPRALMRPSLLVHPLRPPLGALCRWATRLAGRGTTPTQTGRSRRPYATGPDLVRLRTYIARIQPNPNLYVTLYQAVGLGFHTETEFFKELHSAGGC